MLYSGMPAEQKSDETLIDAYKKGDATALDILLGRYETLLRYFIHSISWLQDEGFIDEIIQEASITVFTRLKKGDFDPAKGSFKNWIYGICRNICMERNRAQAARPIGLSKQHLESFPGDLSEIRYYDEAEQPTELEKLSDELAGVLERFNDKERLLLQLINQDGMTYEKIVAYKDVNGWQPFKDDKIPNLRRKVCDLRRFVFKAVEKFNTNKE